MLVLSINEAPDRKPIQHDKGGIQMRRNSVGALVGVAGLAIAVILGIAGGLLTWGSAYVAIQPEWVRGGLQTGIG